MSVCEKCGAKINSEDKFCVTCGYPVKQPTNTESSPVDSINSNSENKSSNSSGSQPIPYKGRDLKYVLPVEPKEASTGATKTIKYMKENNCTSCNGTGARVGTPFEICLLCKGYGIVKQPTTNAINTCSRCGGRGTLIQSACKQCKGKGRIKSPNELNISVPAGVKTGDMFSANGQGDAGKNGGPNGDLYIEIKITFDSGSQRDHPFFGKEYRGTGIGASVLMTSTRFYEDHIQYGNEVIPYSDLTKITITHGASSMLNGTAVATHKPSGRTLNFSFNTHVLGFEKAVEFANEEIDKVNGVLDSRLFFLRSPDGNKLEVYEDYISINSQASRYINSNGTNSGIEIIMFSQISRLDASNGVQICIDYTNDNGSPVQSAFSFNTADTNTVNEIIAYITNNKKSTTVFNENENLWKSISGTNREFALMGKTLVINDEMDMFNSYRKMYMDCAYKYSKQLRIKYLKNIHDFDTFMNLYIPMYKEFLDKIVKKTTDILVSAGVWTETDVTITERHTEAYHLAIDDYLTMLESLRLTIVNNKQSMELLTSLIPNVVGGGFGISGAVKGIASATVFNLARDGAASALINSTNISAAQKLELFGRIDQTKLFNRAFLDYWRVFQTLVVILKENNKTIWQPTDADSAKADNIMKNISNPNFPQDQFPDVMITVICMNPYKRSIYELLRTKDVDEKEVTEIMEYFGYTKDTPDIVG